MADDPASDTEYDSEEIEKIEEDRKRYNTHAYIVTGIKPSAAYRKKLKEVRAKKKGKGKGIRQETYSLSEEVTITAKVNCPCHDGCTADHGALYSASTMSKRHGRLDRINVKEDTGSGPNWISASEARTLSLPLHELEEPWEGRTLSGEVFKATHYVSMTLVGQQGAKSCHDNFLIAPEGYPVDAVMVGREFIENWGHPFALFERQRDDGFLVVQNRKSKTESAEIEVRRAEMERKAKEVAERRQQLRSESPKYGVAGAPRKFMSVASE